MYRPQSESFVIQIKGGEGGDVHTHIHPLSPMKLLDRFRKIIMRFVFSLPSPRHKKRTSRGERFSADPPKTSCSSYHYSPNSHYNEAIADCIEFFNKSSQEGSFAARNSDVQV